MIALAPRRSRIEAALRPKIAALGGIAVAVTNREGETLEIGLGHRDNARMLPVASDTVFRIASLTKAITAAAAMQLVERGRLDLDAPAGDVLPLLHRTQVLTGFGDDGAPLLRAPRTPITLRHLLTHTGGFVYDTWDEPIARYEALRGLPIVITGQAAALDSPLRTDPGERCVYGINLDMVGRMIEEVSDERLETYCATHILAPLGMMDTGYAQRADWGDRVAQAYARTPDGSLLPIDPPPVPSARDFDPGGNGLFSTPRDYLRFLRMLLAGGELDGVRVLSPDATTALLTNQTGDLPVTPLVTRDPALSASVDLFPDARPRWSFAMMLTLDAIPGRRSAGSGGWGGLFNTHYWIDPAAGVTGVFMTQVTPFLDPQALAAFEAFERAVYAN